MKTLAKPVAPGGGGRYPSDRQRLWWATKDWLRVRIEARRSDGADLEIELLRPLDWLQETGLDRVGMPFDVTYDDLGVRAIGLVTEIGPCEPIAPGDGQVVIGRFITRDATRLTRVVFADPENPDETAELVGTPIHRIWSHDRQDWVPLAQLVVGEQVLGENGPVLVAFVESLARQAAVYNLETHGEHVYQVTSLGVVVHNTNKQCVLGGKAAGDLAEDAGKAVAKPQVYETGLAKDLRKNALRGTSVHHAPQSRQAESLLGQFSRRNNVGNEIAIRLTNVEHDLVTLAQKLRSAPSSARSLLASDIHILRQFTNAPNSALKDLIKFSKDIHFWDYLPLR